MSDLVVADHESVALLLTWTAPGADGFDGMASLYDLRIATSDSTAWRAMARVLPAPAPRVAGTRESLWVGGLAAETRYTFLLAAADADSIWSAPSNRAAGTTGARDLTPPGILVVRLSRVTPTSIVLAWTAAGDDDLQGTASRYDARIRESSSEAPWRMVEGLPPPRPAGELEQITIGGLSPDTRYALSVRAVDRAGNVGPWSYQLVVATASEADAHWWEGFAAPPAGQGIEGTVRALAPFQGLLLAGGRFTRAGAFESSGLAAWDGSAWSSLGAGVSGYGGSEVRRLVTDGTLLYAGGHFTTMNGIATGAVAVWDGARWSALGEGVHGSITDLTFHEGALIAGGGFRIGASGPSIRFARWDGAAWSALPMPPGLTDVRLASFRGVLYAGSYPSVIDGDSMVELFRLAGDRWLPAMFRPGDGSYIPEYCCDGIRQLRVIGEALYAVGSGINYFGDVAVYDGTRWSGQGLRLENMWEESPDVACAGELQGAPVVGGWFILKEYPRSCDVAILESGSWRPLGSGVGSREAWPNIVHGRVLALAEYQGDLYAAGSFEQAGGKPSASIARWIP